MFSSPYRTMFNDELHTCIERSTDLLMLKWPKLHNTMYCRPPSMHFYKFNLLVLIWILKRMFIFIEEIGDSLRMFIRCIKLESISCLQSEEVTHTSSYSQWSKRSVLFELFICRRWKRSKLCAWKLSKSKVSNFFLAVIRFYLKHSIVYPKIDFFHL